MQFSLTPTLNAKIEKIVRQTLAEQVYADLKALLQAGEVEPGQRFTLRGLAATIGTSAMPVREAINRLAAEQALEVLPNRAIRVPMMTRARFLELRTIRIHLEGLAVEHAATMQNDDDLARIEHDEQAFRHACLHADGRQAVRSNKNLHFNVYRAARMPTLLRMIESLWLQIGPVLNYDLASSRERMEHSEAGRHHAAMVAAIRARDGAAARLALEADLTSASEFILASAALDSGQVEPART